MMSGVPSINLGIINSITKLHLLGISTESYYDARIQEYQTENISKLPIYTLLQRNEYIAWNFPKNLMSNILSKCR